jgi:hypothetical protein
VSGVWTCFQACAEDRYGKFTFALGRRFLAATPRLGGTLLVEAVVGSESGR